MYCLFTKYNCIQANIMTLVYIFLCIGGKHIFIRSPLHAVRLVLFIWLHQTNTDEKAFDSWNDTVVNNCVAVFRGDLIMYTNMPVGLRMPIDVKHPQSPFRTNWLATHRNDSNFDGLLRAALFVDLRSIQIRQCILGHLSTWHWN